MNTQQLISETQKKIAIGDELTGLHYLIALEALSLLGIAENRRTNQPIDNYYRYRDFQHYGNEREKLTDRWYK